MKPVELSARIVFGVALCLATVISAAADYPVPKEGTAILRDFRLHTGEVLPELRLHYTTVGAATGEPALLLHGTTGSGAMLLTPAFGGELFGPGQALDASRYYIILPDAIGHGKSSKPSDGLRLADDERNPPELGVLDREIKRVKKGRVFLIPASADTAGHGTTGQARFWKKELADVLQTSPHAGP